jgi:Fe-S-cluster containining protein
MSMTSTFPLPVIESPVTSSPCTSCHAGCCRAYAVPLTGRDIFRIVTELKIPFWKFVCRRSDPSGAISRGIAPYFRFDDDPRTPYVICLLQNESRLFPGTRKCGFLTESGPSAKAPRGIGRCTIYAHRPVACRVFPSGLDELGELAVHEVPEPSGEFQHEAYELCPRPWSVADLDRDAALQTLRECAAEMELFHAVANRWNDSPGPWPLFPDFLELIYTAFSAA